MEHYSESEASDHSGHSDAGKVPPGHDIEMGDKGSPKGGVKAKAKRKKHDKKHDDHDIDSDGLPDASLDNDKKSSWLTTAVGVIIILFIGGGLWYAHTHNKCNWGSSLPKPKPAKGKEHDGHPHNLQNVYHPVYDPIVKDATITFDVIAEQCKSFFSNKSLEKSINIQYGEVDIPEDGGMKMGKQIYLAGRDMYTGLIQRFEAGNNFLTQEHFWSSRRDEIVKHYNGVRVILHKKQIELLKTFIALKSNSDVGTPTENTFYKDTCNTVGKLVRRLITQRPLVFSGDGDLSFARPGEISQLELRKTGYTEGHYNRPKLLKEYITYDEIELAALLGVSVPTHAINSGARNNIGRRGPESEYNREIILVALVGCRFERPGLMEMGQMVPTSSPPDNYRKPHPDLRAAWSKFYGVDLQKTHGDDYVEYFNKKAYLARNKITAELFFADASRHGNLIPGSGGVVAVVVGLGLGQWDGGVTTGKHGLYSLTKQELTNLYIESYLEALYEQVAQYDNTIETVVFNWIDADYQRFQFVSKTGHGTYTLKNGNKTITIEVNRLDPYRKRNGKLVVAMYAWDGNSFPGNEYWSGHWSDSGDPAAACATTIGILQNSITNPDFPYRILKQRPGEYPEAVPVVPPVA